MAGLGVDELREVHGETGLGDAFDEAVREAVDVQAVQGPHPVGPLVGEGQPVATDDLEAGALRVAGADFESGSENQTVQRVFDAVHDDAVSGDLLDPEAVGVDQGDVAAVERLQVFVVKHGRLQ